MTKEETTEMVRSRIKADINHFKGNLPERYSIAWHGYIAGIFECGVIDIPSYDQLVELLPKISEPNPILEIFEGRDDEDE